MTIEVAPIKLFTKNEPFVDDTCFLRNWEVM